MHPDHAYEYDWRKFPNGAVIGGIGAGYIYYVSKNTITPGLFLPRYANASLDAIYDGKMYELKKFERIWKEK